MSFGDIAGLWLATGLTLFLFSFLYRDNPFYKLGEHLYLGVTIGYMLVKLVYETWIPKVWNAENYALVIPPVIIGFLLLTRFVPKVSWLSRWSFAFIIGYGSGLAIPATFTSIILKQAEATTRPLVTVPTAAEQKALEAAEKTLADTRAARGNEAPETRAAEKAALSARRSGTYSWVRAYADVTTIILFLGVFSVLFYFFFSIEHKGPVRIFSRVGVLFLMIYFGASYGYTVMGRFALLYDRLLDVRKASGGDAWFATPIILVLMIGVLVWRHRTGKASEEPSH
ncbi:MAG: hypothetical protein HYY18_08935 [Planctomycetes bacterium]|nr:hypothetical protein [Planctomycetota bacterium]